jgi:hypothetical protein
MCLIMKIADVLNEFQGEFPQLAPYFDAGHGVNPVERSLFMFELLLPYVFRSDNNPELIHRFELYDGIQKQTFNLSVQHPSDRSMYHGEVGWSRSINGLWGLDKVSLIAQNRNQVTFPDSRARLQISEALTWRPNENSIAGSREDRLFMYYELTGEGLVDPNFTLVSGEISARNSQNQQIHKPYTGSKIEVPTLAPDPTSSSDLMGSIPVESLIIPRAFSLQDLLLKILQPRLVHAGINPQELEDLFGKKRGEIPAGYKATGLSILY